MSNLKIARVEAYYGVGRILISFENGQEISLTGDELSEAVLRFLHPSPSEFFYRLSHCEHCSVILRGSATEHATDCPVSQIIAAFPAHAAAADAKKENQFAAAEQRYDQRQGPPVPPTLPPERPARGNTDHWPEHPIAQQLREQISQLREQISQPSKRNPRRRPAGKKQLGAPHHEPE